MTGDGVSYVAAFGAGVVSFLSPCVLPLVPAYLAMVTGLEVAEVRAPTRRHLARIGRDTGLFVLGFSVVFILLGLSATTIGSVLIRNQLLLTRLSGIFVLSMALFLLGSLVLQSSWLSGEARFHPSPSRFGPFAAPITGAAFAFGWTPCIGPVLGSVLAIGATQGEALRGASLMAVYSLGLGLPFLLSGLLFGHLSRVFAWIKDHFTVITAVSALALAFFGVLLVLNRLIWVTTQVQSGMRSVGLDGFINLG
ncbi:MAG: cytochrome c biogenesis protein CcdA [Acidimicrobiia bacterium]